MTSRAVMVARRAGLVSFSVIGMGEPTGEQWATILLDRTP